MLAVGGERNAVSIFACEGLCNLGCFSFLNGEDQELSVLGIERIFSSADWIRP